jgi:hypothetical protein
LLSRPKPSRNEAVEPYEEEEKCIDGNLNELMEIWLGS